LLSNHYVRTGRKTHTADKDTKTNQPAYARIQAKSAMLLYDGQSGCGPDRRDTPTVKQRIMNDFFLRAMAAAIEKYPLMAGTFRDDYIEIAETIDIGLAVAAPKGLVVPVIRNANKKSLADIAKESVELIEKARNNKLSFDELTGACMTLTALGMFGIDSFLAIPSPGQCGILSVGKINEEPVLRDGKPEAKKVIEFGLAADHRIVTPAYGAEFLTEITSLVSNPQKLTG
jgi:pyruvate dehydrogenase E2 component (dihydrolipoamide acetyltransferase)